MLCVRWYLRYSVNYQDLEEIMAERGLSVDYVTIWRWGFRWSWNRPPRVPPPRTAKNIRDLMILFSRRSCTTWWGAANSRSR
jgi:hypothetical protein